jgi:hypothetical protein
MIGLYHNENGKTFSDVAPRSEVGRASLLSVTWAVLFLDYDLDDFSTSSPSTAEPTNRRAWTRAHDCASHLCFSATRQSGTFETSPRRSVRPLNTDHGSWGAYLDFDGDGDLDLVVTTLDGRASLFRNDGGNRYKWLRVRAVGTTRTRAVWAPWCV